MNPVTHFLISWGVANGPRETNRRERTIVAIGGIVPDVDGLGAVPDVLTRLVSENPTSFFHVYHHKLHCLGFAVLATGVATALAPSGRRARTATLFALTFHVHLLCDVIGARGPDGDQWPIPYLLPFSDALRVQWSGQWALNAWPNFAITFAFLALAAVLAVRRGYSFVEVVSTRADAAVVATLRRRFGR